ncbi:MULTISPECIES: hypothetical protein [Anoxybacillaceae]|jgi:hypothetical protein|uniref:hypothetical protein n=1 Tax=Anoxybacillaceae TaxID=3120669 RepID=UPI0009B993B9|nr:MULTISPECIES: hypothetical protein [Anoxybacillus]MBB3907433.1 hypothetical protein [Anoxybacillus rupiensis]OQM46656.1 hypothetical protein B6A27_05725 [Anoxybacillus sp. UARK-01]QHC03300.1 hypothetical protein GRQ40_04475 [Anoxybacillus sp. PDR2]
MYTVGFPYDAFFYYANRPGRTHSGVPAAFPITACSRIAEQNNAATYQRSRSRRPDKEKQTAAARFEAELTGKGQRLNQSI